MEPVANQFFAEQEELYRVLWHFSGHLLEIHHQLLDQVQEQCRWPEEEER